MEIIKLFKNVDRLDPYKSEYTLKSLVEIGARLDWDLEIVLE